jgi:hypothetical protein
VVLADRLPFEIDGSREQMLGAIRQAALRVERAEVVECDRDLLGIVIG